MPSCCQTTMAAPLTVSVSDLMKYYGLTEKECNCGIKDAHLEDISRTLGKDWRSLPSQFGMPNISKNDIDRDFKTEKEKRYALFCQWKEMEGSAATYKKLMMALLAIDCREDAEGVCKLLKKSFNPSLDRTPRIESQLPEASKPGSYLAIATSL